jgi:xanthine dehydrogenase YagR molybdenum-binding subunit
MSPDAAMLPPLSNRPLNAGSSMNDDASRLDALAKVTGSAKYGRDVYPANALFIAFVRCPYGSATLEACDTDAAKAVPGVVEADVSKRQGNYHGATVGHVAADSPLSLRRGMAALACRWKRKGDAVTTIEQGIDAEPEVPIDAKSMLEQAGERTLDAVYSTEVQTHSSLETHGACVDHKGDSAVVYVSTQGTSSARDGLDEALGLPASKFEVVCEYVGGGFGSKLNGAGKEGMLAAKIAAKYKRPAYLFVNRAEEHLDTGNRPSSRTHVRVAFEADGTIKGGHIQTWGGVGPNRGGGGVNVPSGRYRLGQITTAHADVSLNAGMPRAFRAPGHPQGAFPEELMLDEVAARCGLDPLTLRLRLIKADAIREMAEMGAKLIGWDKRPAMGSQTGAIRRGMGMGVTSWGRFPAAVEAEVIINRDGSVEARTGTQDIGTGQRTVVGIVTADAIGVPLEAVTVRIGRSTLPAGPGSGGSVTTVNSAPAFMEAGKDAASQLLELVAARTGTPAGELSIADGEVRRGGAKVLGWKEACSLIPDAITGKGRNNQRTVAADKSTGTSGGAQFVDLDVDVETGVIKVHRIVAVQACGRVVSRKLAESQVIGGVIQGLSYALFEERVLDRQTGAMVNPNLEWYKIAGPGDMPLIEPVMWAKDKETAGPRPLGEPPTIPTAGAIACAVFNAIGTPVRSLPITPGKVLAAIAKAAAGQGGAK